MSTSFFSKHGPLPYVGHLKRNLQQNKKQARKARVQLFRVTHLPFLDPETSIREHMCAELSRSLPTQSAEQQRQSPGYECAEALQYHQLPSVLLAGALETIVSKHTAHPPVPKNSSVSPFSTLEEPLLSEPMAPTGYKVVSRNAITRQAQKLQQQEQEITSLKAGCQQITNRTRTSGYTPTQKQLVMLSIQEGGKIYLI